MAPHLGNEKFVAKPRPKEPETESEHVVATPFSSDNGDHCETSIEEAMGITPADYDAQNWMPKVFMPASPMGTLPEEFYDKEPEAM